MTFFEVLKNEKNGRRRQPWFVSPMKTFHLLSKVVITEKELREFADSRTINSKGNSSQSLVLTLNENLNLEEKCKVPKVVNMTISIKDYIFFF